MKETGLVVALNDKNAQVKIERKSACGSCKGCRMGSSEEMSITIEVSNEIGANIGDIVEVDMETINILLAAFIMYGIPLIALLTGVFVSYLVSQIWVHGSDAVHMLIGILFMVSAFLIIKKNENKIKQSTKFKPMVSQIVGKNIL